MMPGVIISDTGWNGRAVTRAASPTLPAGAPSASSMYARVMSSESNSRDHSLMDAIACDTVALCDSAMNSGVISPPASSSS